MLQQYVIGAPSLDDIEVSEDLDISGPSYDEQVEMCILEYRILENRNEKIILLCTSLRSGRRLFCLLIRVSKSRCLLWAFNGLPLCFGLSVITFRLVARFVFMENNYFDESRSRSALF